MRTLYLHIGHSKTGSSFLQASFANSIDAMAAQGVEYPGAPNAAAAGWKISSGNGQSLLTAAPESYEFSHDKVFFSTERLFVAFAAEKEWQGRLTAFCAHHDIATVEVLLFLRDPIPHAESSYQQMVKRGGSTEAVATTYKNYKYPDMVRAALTRDFGELTVNWHVYNYDRHRSELIAITETFLGLPVGTLVRGDDRPVNRSMTAGELNILRGLNRHDTTAAARLADALCNDAPEVESETVYPPRPVQRKMLERLAPAIAEVDDMLVPEERYGVDLQPPGRDADSHTFTNRQIEVIARTLGERVSEVTKQMQIERARRQINMAQSLIEKERRDEALVLVERAEVALNGLDNEGDAEGLRRLVGKIKSGLAAKAEDESPTDPKTKTAKKPRKSEHSGTQARFPD